MKLQKKKLNALMYESKKYVCQSCVFLHIDILSDMHLGLEYSKYAKYAKFALKKRAKRYYNTS